MAKKLIIIHDDSSDTSSGDDLGFIWAQCESNKCQKWRRLDKDIFEKEGKQDQKWYCWMNSDTNYNDCSKPEEKWKSEEYKYNQEFELYSIVNAKYGIYPIWPAMITLCPNKKKYTNHKKSVYHVELFGKARTHGWVETHNIELLFLDTKMKVGCASKHYTKVKEAFEVAKQALSTKMDQRVELLEHQEGDRLSSKKKDDQSKFYYKKMTKCDYVCTSNGSSPCTGVLNSETFANFSELHQYGKRLLDQMEELLARINHNVSS